MIHESVDLKRVVCYKAHALSESAVNVQNLHLKMMGQMRQF